MLLSLHGFPRIVLLFYICFISINGTTVQLAQFQFTTVGIPSNGEVLRESTPEVTSHIMRQATYIPHLIIELSIPYLLVRFVNSQDRPSLGLKLSNVPLARSVTRLSVCHFHPVHTRLFKPVTNRFKN